MKQLSKRVKENYIKRYNNSTYKSLFQCYNKPSYRKIRIYNNLIRHYQQQDHLIIVEYKIISYNTNYFTIGFKVFNDEIKKFQLIVETPYNTYIITQ